ncbi:MAG TPA: LCP family protein [Mycobacteriales bacterium]|nr:LCP family protein [Mycobacteriales bacterium]
MTTPSLTTEPGGTRIGRRAELRRRRRQRRQRVLGGVVVLALLAGGLVAWRQQRDAAQEQPLARAPQRTQATLLLQLQGENGAAVATALLAHDPASRSGSAVLVPPQVIVNVPGTGQIQLGRALKSVPPTGSRNAVADLLGVTVDGGWVIDLPAMAALIDAIGGVRVDVDVPVIVSRQVLVNAGTQRLDGLRAVRFATYIAPAEQEQARLARLQELLDGILTGLPKSTPDVARILQGLGRRSVPSLPVPQLAQFLIGLAADGRSNAMQFDVLPVIPIDPGNGALSFRVDAPAARALVDRLLSQSVPPGARSGDNRVLVLNGVGTPGLGEKVRDKLVPAGFVYVGARNAPTFGHTRTQVLVREATAPAQALGARVAKALGVPVTSVATAELGTIADVIVLVGADFVG